MGGVSGARIWRKLNQKIQNHLRALAVTALIWTGLSTQDFVFAQEFCRSGAEVFLQNPFAYINEEDSVAVLIHGASQINGVHLVDTLLAAGLHLVRIFTPEHGWLRTYEAGKHVPDTIYQGIPVVSLYGKNREVPPFLLEGIQTLIVDLQDLGVRCYTYVSTLYYVMRSACQQGVQVVILDRPVVDAQHPGGPLLRDSALRSFVGVIPVPLQYAMTPGEIARMMIDEGWLPECREFRSGFSLVVVPVPDYTRKQRCCPDVPPSPALQSCQAMEMYPWLVLLEGTRANPLRGTGQAFQGACFFIPGDSPARQWGDTCWFIPKRWGHYPSGWCCGWIWTPPNLQGARPWYWLMVLEHHYQRLLLSTTRRNVSFWTPYIFQLTGDSLFVELLDTHAPVETFQWYEEVFVRPFLERRLKYLLYRDEPTLPSRR